MAEYQPTSRRPIAGMFRRTADAAVRWCVAHDVHPHTVSYGSVVAAGLAAICFWLSGRWPWLLIVAPGFCYLRLWCNMLDGMVALASGKASPRGEIINELPDRVSDVLIFVGVAHSGLCSPYSGYWTAIAALFVAYVGMLGQAVGVHRDFSGPMSKPWRMVVLHLGAWAQYALIFWNKTSQIVAGLSLLDLTCVTILAGCALTVFIRLRRIMRALSAKQQHTRVP